MTPCRDFRELRSASLDQALSPEEQARLDEHLKGCSECRSALKEYQSIHRQIHGLEAVESPPWLTSKIMARIRAEARPSFWRRFIRPLVVKPQLQVASILLLCATGYYLLKTQRQESGSAAPSAQSKQAAQLQEDKKDASSLKPAPSQAELRPMKEKSAFAPPPPPSPATNLSQAAGQMAPPESGMKKTEAPKEEPLPVPASAPPVAAQMQAGASAVAPGRRAKAAAPETTSRAGGVAEGNAPADTMESKYATEYTRDSAPLSIHWEPMEPPSARQSIEKIVAQMGAKLVVQPGREQAKVLTIRLDARRLPELVERLSRLGTVREAPEPSRTRSGFVTVSIRW